VFEKNSYFAGTELKKTFVMAKNHVIEKGSGCEIEWASGCDPTQMKKKKKKKQGGKTKNITVSVKTDSFFNFFDTVEAKDIDQ